MKKLSTEITTKKGEIKIITVAYIISNGIPPFQCFFVKNLYFSKHH